MSEERALSVTRLPAEDGATSSDELALSVTRLLAEACSTVAVAESLTGGLLGAAFTDVPGASAVFRGGITPYATDLKTSLLDVPAELLERNGPVAPDVAAAMADGVRRRLASTYGLAATGVAGPEPQGDVSPGTVYVAFADRRGAVVRRLHLAGNRNAVRTQTVHGALELVWTRLRSPADGEAPTR